MNDALMNDLQEVEEVTEDVIDFLSDRFVELADMVTDRIESCISNDDVAKAQDWQMLAHGLIMISLEPYHHQYRS